MFFIDDPGGKSIIRVSLLLFNHFSLHGSRTAIHSKHNTEMFVGLSTKRYKNKLD